jgi:plastocyanin
MNSLKSSPIATSRIIANILFIIALLSLGTLTVYAADSTKEAGHDHGAWKEKRFITTVGADGVQRAEMVGGDYYYDPNYIIVKVDKPVELKVKKAAGYIPHNLVAKSPEAGIEFNIDLKGDQLTVKFTPKKTGKFQIYCEKRLLFFKSHREKGMEGMIEVIE